MGIIGAQREIPVKTAPTAEQLEFGTIALDGETCPCREASGNRRFD